MDQSHASDASSALRVELEIYSGRVNPSWAIDADAAAEFRRRLAALPTAASAPDTAEALGYRGLRVTGRADGAAEIVVARGGVTVRRAASASGTFRDDGRALERWLLDTGRAALDPALYAYVVGEIGR